MVSLVIIGALALDQLLGEPKRYHPLVGFGKIAASLEQRCNHSPSKILSTLLGFICTLLVVTPWVLITLFTVSWAGKYYWLIELAVLYWAIGLRSLQLHIHPIQTALQKNNISTAREKLSLTVSRDTERLNSQQVTQATIETTLENGNDAVFAALFCYLIGGAPLAVAYRLINTLDAMWGYRSERYEYFGKTAAKMDDVLNYLPARLTAITYSLCGNFSKGVRAWFASAALLNSPNAGPVMTAGAGSLNVQLGGDSYYDQTLITKPLYGGINKPEISDIQRALCLVKSSVIVWCLAVLLISVVVWFSRSDLI